MSAPKKRLPRVTLAAVALLVLLCSVALATASSAVPRNAQGACENPRAAIYQLLYWMQPERADATRAAKCIDPELDATPEEASRLARQLYRVLNAKGLHVYPDEVPAKAGYRSEELGGARYVLFPTRLPEVDLVQRGDRWVLSADAMRAAEDLFQQTVPFDLDHWLETLPSWTRAPLLGIPGVTAWQLVSVLLLFLLALVASRLFVFSIKLWLRRVQVDWVREALVAAQKPTSGLMVAGVFSVAIPILQFPPLASRIGLLAVRVLAAWSIVWLGFRLVDVVAGILARKAELTDTKLDDQLVPLVRKSLKLIIGVIGTLFILQNLDVDVGSLIAGLGLGGLAFALAAKDTVANLFGSVMIFIDKPFQVGDVIQMGDVEGVVEEVGFRTSRVRTFHNSLLTVPNARVTDSAIDNLGARKFRRYKTVLSLTYDTPADKITAFCDGLHALIQSLEHMRKDFDLVEFTGFGASGLDVLLYCFMDTDDWTVEMRTRHNLNLGILQLAEELGVSFAFPTQTLHVDSVAPTRPLPTPKAAKLGANELSAIATAYGPGGRRLGELSQRRPPNEDAALFQRANSGGD